MKYALNALAVLLLIIGVVRLAAADAGSQVLPVHAPGLREQMRAIRFEQQAMLQREHQPQSTEPQSPESQSPEAQPEPQSHDMDADPASPSAQAPASGSDDVFRGGRMTPEERRALRQQINDAGHEIYAPSH